MKKTIIGAVAAAAILAGGAQSAMAVNPLEALGGIVTSLTSTTKFEVSDLQGTWSYQSPAVSFDSDQALNKIGGTAASVAVEDKLKPYYEKLGVTSMTLVVDADANFTMKIKAMTLTGTVSKDSDDGKLTFNFSAFGKLKLGSVSARAQKSATNVLTLTFDVSKVVAIADKVASVANLSTIKTVVNLLNSYDGIYAGAKFKKTGSATSQADVQTSIPDDSGNTSASDVKSKAAEALQGLLGGKKSGNR